MSVGVGGGPVDHWARFEAITRELRAWSDLRGLASWDQQTGMPAAAGPGRSQQLALLARVRHELLQRPDYGDTLAALRERETDPVRRRAVEWATRDWERAARVPPALAARVAELQGESFAAWLEARRSGGTTAFLRSLRPLLGAVIETARCVDPVRSPYDTLLDAFDPGTDTAFVTAQFARLRPGLRQLLGAIREAPPIAAVGVPAALDQQLALSREVAAALGYDLSAGAVALAEHPFTVRCGDRDVRLTTRFKPDDVLEGLSSTMHEAGHAMFEQGMPAALAPLGLMASPSMGMHESQSRFWENTVGRSLPFLEWVRERLAVLGIVAPDARVLYRSVNRVAPSFVRVEADEVTYNLHVAVRFELERDLIAGTLDVGDLEGAWNDAYARELGLRPTTPREGVLQDVHWSQGAFGYFPSYTLGNMYAACFARRLAEDLPDRWTHVRRGTFGPLLGWFRERVHARGALLDAPALLREVVGEVDPVTALLDQLWERHGALYGCVRP